jgi:hypothetical protein
VEKGTVGGGGHHQKHGAPKQQQHHHHRKLESNGSSISDVSLEEENNFLGICSQELLARGTELLKRTRKGDSFFSPVIILFMMCCYNRMRVLVYDLSES